MANKTIKIQNPDTLQVEGTYTTAAFDSFYYNTKGNLNIETDSSLVTGTISNGTDTRSGGKINIEPDSDFQVKPGDDVIFYSHHRPGWTGDPESITEVSLKILDGDTAAGGDRPVNLQLNAANITFTTKDKILTKNANYINKNGITTPYLNSQDTQYIFNMNFKTGIKESAATKPNPDMAYLKLRARAIDLRCEGTGGGIAIQPLGCDSAGNEDKIKFEHGGGDGLEWFTSNTQKHSVFTDEYRFNKNGILKMATREKTDSDKKNASDITTYYKYKKNSTGNQKDGYEPADDFYDFVKLNDPTCTWKDVIKVGYALSNYDGIHTKITSDGNLEIGSSDTYTIERLSTLPSNAVSGATFPDTSVNPDGIYVSGDIIGGAIKPYFSDSKGIDGTVKYAQIQDSSYIKITYNTAPQIHIQSDTDVELASANDDVKLTSGDAIKMEAPEIKMTAKEQINFSTTKKLLFLTTFVSKKGKMDITDASLMQGYTNNMERTVYLTSTGKVKVPMDTLYTDTNHTNALVFDSTWTASGNVYYYDGTPVPGKSKVIIAGPNGSVYYGDINSSSQLKKFSSTGHELLASSGSTTADGNTIYVSSDYTPVSGEQTIEPRITVESPVSASISDLINLVSYAKTQGWIS